MDESPSPTSVQSPTQHYKLWLKFGVPTALLLGIGYRLLMIYGGTAALQTTMLTFSNSLFGYDISYNSSWRVAVDYSEQYTKGLKSVALIQQAAPACISDNGNFDTEAFKECVLKHPELNSIESQYRDYSSKWTPETSEVVILTDLSKDEELKFLSDVHSGKKTYNNFPQGHKIEITVMDSVLSFSKETPPDSNLPLKYAFYSLPNGTRAYQADERAEEFGTLAVNVPHDFNSGSALSGKSGRSLNIATTARQGSEQEKIFFDVVKSLTFR